MPRLMMKSQHALARPVHLSRIQHRLWSDHGIYTTQYKNPGVHSCDFEKLLNGCETWTQYRLHIKLLEQFHQRCLRKICKVSWTDRMANTDVLDLCGISSVEAMKRYKDVLHATLKSYDIAPQSFKTTAMDRTLWRSRCSEGCRLFEEERTARLIERRRLSHAAASSVPQVEGSPFVCGDCHQTYASRIGLLSHLRHKH